MYAELVSIDRMESARLNDELRRFFGRIRTLYDALEAPRHHLNRLQRQRCRHNLMTLRYLENEYYKIEYEEDIRQIYRLVMHYIHLDENCLTQLLSQEQIARPTLFLF